MEEPKEKKYTDLESKKHLFETLKEMDDKLGNELKELENEVPMQ